MMRDRKIKTKEWSDDAPIDRVIRERKRDPLACVVKLSLNRNQQEACKGFDLVAAIYSSSVLERTL